MTKGTPIEELKSRVLGAWKEKAKEKGTPLVKDFDGLFWSDFTSLFDDQWLKVSVIDFFIMKTAPQADPSVLCLTIVETQEIQRQKTMALLQRPKRSEMKRIKKILFPIFDNDHYYLISVDLMSHTVEVYDGLKRSKTLPSQATLASRYAKLVAPRAKDFTGTIVNTPNQKDAFNCGVHLLAAYFQRALPTTKASWTSRHMPFLRLDLLTEFVQFQTDRREEVL